jgi:putative IMPACT (imprinted ancient) family translation regulator
LPLLEVYLKQDVYDFCCVATRYYGGVMLGAGGLVRAYARCGAMALEAAGVGTMREMALCTAVVPYALYERVKRLVAAAGADVFAEEFGAEITMEFELDAEALTELQREIAEATSGSVYVHAGGTGWKVM